MIPVMEDLEFWHEAERKAKELMLHCLAKLESSGTNITCDSMDYALAITKKAMWLIRLLRDEKPKVEEGWISIGDITCEMEKRIRKYLKAEKQTEDQKLLIKCPVDGEMMSRADCEGCNFYNKCWE